MHRAASGLRPRKRQYRVGSKSERDTDHSERCDDRKESRSALGIALDTAGDLYTTDATGKTVYAIQRTAAALNLGTVQDGATNSANVTLESDGNLPATLATPDVTEPTNTMFTLVPAASNGCTSGTAGPPGVSCQFTGTFAPPPATANGLQTGQATINVATPAFTFNVGMSGSATVSAIQPQTITGFNPPTALQEGQVIMLSATGGASGNPVVFSIDPTSACLNMCHRQRNQRQRADGSLYWRHQG